jgi:hypothetical protein
MTRYATALVRYFAGRWVAVNFTVFPHIPLEL